MFRYNIITQPLPPTIIHKLHQKCQKRKQEEEIFWTLENLLKLYQQMKFYRQERQTYCKWQTLKLCKRQKIIKKFIVTFPCCLVSQSFGWVEKSESFKKVNQMIKCGRTWLDSQLRFAFESSYYLEGVSSVGVVTMTRADRSLLSNQISDFLKLAAVDIAITVQVEHFKCYFKVPTRG